MTSVTATSGAGSQAASQTPTPTTTISSDFDTFLKMMTVQMENQDPLNPMDSAEFSVQLATFSAVEQQALTNDLLRNLLDYTASSGLSEMADWIGTRVRVAVDAGYEGQPITLSPSPPAIASSSELVVWDSAGNERNRFAIPVTDTPVEWAGVDASGAAVPWGTYGFEVHSYDGNGELIDVHQPEIYADVIEARHGANGLELVLKGGTLAAADLVTAVRAVE